MVINFITFDLANNGHKDHKGGSYVGQCSKNSLVIDTCTNTYMYTIHFID